MDEGVRGKRYGHRLEVLIATELLRFLISCLLKCTKFVRNNHEGPQLCF